MAVTVSTLWPATSRSDLTNSSERCGGSSHHGEAGAGRGRTLKSTEMWRVWWRAEVERGDGLHFLFLVLLEFVLCTLELLDMLPLLNKMHVIAFDVACTHVHCRGGELGGPRRCEPALPV